MNMWFCEVQNSELKNKLTHVKIFIKSNLFEIIPLSSKIPSKTHSSIDSYALFFHFKCNNMSFLLHATRELSLLYFSYMFSLFCTFTFCLLSTFKYYCLYHQFHINGLKLFLTHIHGYYPALWFAIRLENGIVIVLHYRFYHIGLYRCAKSPYIFCYPI